MGRVLNLMAFVIFATALFMRSVDPVIPQIAQDLKVTTTTAAMLSTGFTLPYALVQPVLGALADMFSKTRLIALSMLIVGIATLACGLATNFETLMALRLVAGATAGGVFPIALAVAGDRVPVQQRQVAIGRLLFAAMSGNLLGASGAGVVGDIFGWRAVFFFTGAIDLVALAVAIPGFRNMGEKPGRFDLSTLIPNYRAIFSNPMAKYCFGAVFIEAVFLFGVFPYMAGFAHRRRGALFGSGRSYRWVWGRWRHLHFYGRMAAREHRRAQAYGSRRYDDGVLSPCHRTAHAMAGRVCKFYCHGFRILPAARLHPGLRHGVGSNSTRFGDGSPFHVLLPRSGSRSRGLRHRAQQHWRQRCADRRRGRSRRDGMGLCPANAPTG